MKDDKMIDEFANEIHKKTIIELGKKEKIIVESDTSLVKKDKSFLQTLIDSKSLPIHIRNVEIAFTIEQYGKELGFGIMQSFHYIIPINGRLSLNATAIAALLRKNGIKYRTLKDAEYLLEDGNYVKYKPEGVKSIDRVTEIEFTRDGVVEIVSYSYQDAKKAELIDKDNWKRLFKDMCYARCMTKGARRIAPDIIMGMYSINEILDTFDNNQVNSDLYETEIQDSDYEVEN